MVVLLGRFVCFASLSTVADLSIIAKSCQCFMTECVIIKIVKHFVDGSQWFHATIDELVLGRLVLSRLKKRNY